MRTDRGFLGNVVIKKVDDESFKLVEDFMYYNEDLSVTCKKGFITDGYSAPKWARWFMGSPFTGNSLEASIIHDGLYKSQHLNRRYADNMFDEMLEEGFVGKLKRVVSVGVVKLMAGPVWDSMGRKSINRNKELVVIEYKDKR